MEMVPAIKLRKNLTITMEQNGFFRITSMVTMNAFGVVFLALYPVVVLQRILTAKLDYHGNHTD